MLTRPYSLSCQLFSLGCWILLLLPGLAQDEPGVVPAKPVAGVEILAEEEAAEDSVDSSVPETEEIEELPPDPIQALREREEQIQQVFRRVAPSVVALESADPNASGWGSGVLVDEKGLVLTAGHVTEATGEDVIVHLADGRTMPGKRLGSNMHRDASMVQILADESTTFPYVEMADPDTAVLGDWVVAMGHPGGYDATRPAPLRVGRVLQKQSTKLLVTDCTLAGGDSGGALFDLQGRLIGIHSSIAQSLSHNVHVAIAVFHKDWDRMLNGNGESWGELKNLFEEPLPGYESRVDKSNNRALLGAELDTRSRNGVLVRKVRAGFPADEGGLRAGDVIVEFEGKAVSQYTELFPLLSAMDPGDQVEVVVDRRGQEMALEITMGDRAELLGEPRQ